MNIRTVDQLESEITDIYSFVNSTIEDKTEILPEIGSTLFEYYSRTGQMQAQAKIYLNKALKLSYEACKANGMSPNILKDYVKTLTERELYVYELIERTNRSCLHGLEWVRTLISKNKEEMKLSGYRD